MNLNKEHISTLADDRDFKFDREPKGYNKQQVDAKIDELYTQIDELATENAILKSLAEKINQKIRMLGKITERQERKTDDTTATTDNAAEEIIAQARNQAQEIINSAQKEAAEIRCKLDIEIDAVWDILTRATEDLSILTDAVQP